MPPKVRRAQDFTHRVWHVVRQCPRGKVVSYGGVAAILGAPRAARGVGKALKALPANTAVPWWRGINRIGGISIRGGHGPFVQRKLLRKEGVKFNKSDRVDWKKYGWDGVLKRPLTDE